MGPGPPSCSADRKKADSRGPVSRDKEAVRGRVPPPRGRGQAPPGPLPAHTRAPPCLKIPMQDALSPGHGCPPTSKKGWGPRATDGPTPQPHRVGPCQAKEGVKVCPRPRDNAAREK